MTPPSSSGSLAQLGLGQCLADLFVCAFSVDDHTTEVARYSQHCVRPCCEIMGERKRRASEASHRRQHSAASCRCLQPVAAQVCLASRNPPVSFVVLLAHQLASVSCQWGNSLLQCLHTSLIALIYRYPGAPIHNAAPCWAQLPVGSRIFQSACLPWFTELHSQAQLNVSPNQLIVWEGLVQSTGDYSEVFCL